MMLPAQLQNQDFATYPPEAQKLAVDHLALLRRMPLAFEPLLLREVIGYDWKFPVERRELEEQFGYLRGMSEEAFANEMKPFAAIQLSPELEATDWVADPAGFSERLSAHLWATHQIEAFRAASVEYVKKLDGSRTARTLAMPRMVAVVFGQGARGSTYPLFRKLRRAGTRFNNVHETDGRAALLAALKTRATKSPEPYAHWCVDGGKSAPPDDKIAQMSYAQLQGVRDALVTKMRQVMAPGGAGPEALRSMMARMKPQELGLAGEGPEGLLNRFQINVLTEGSGTQLFSTTFVQWSAREILRRAQPLTLVTIYAPRQREQSMQEQLSGKPHEVQTDAMGSLIDADMGAYYTWINANRLPGAAETNFLAWFEEGKEAVAVGPSFGREKEDHGARSIGDLLAQMA